jgi:hypothetical protein
MKENFDPTHPSKLQKKDTKQQNKESPNILPLGYLLYIHIKLGGGGDLIFLHRKKEKKK